MPEHDLIGDYLWSKVCKRAFEHNGCIVDVGCEGWTWSRQFLGRKPVIGYGPQETHIPEGATLCDWCVGASDGTATLRGSGITASMVDGHHLTKEIRTEAIMQVIEKRKPISVLKINVEGMEYALLPVVPHPVSDQLAVSFHDWRIRVSWRRPWTAAIIETLARWYDPIQLQEKWNWWLFVARG